MDDLLVVLLFRIKSHCMQETLISLLRHSEISVMEDIARKNVVSIFRLTLSSCRNRRSEHLEKDKLDIRNDFIQLIR